MQNASQYNADNLNLAYHDLDTLLKCPSIIKIIEKSKIKCPTCMCPFNALSEMTLHFSKSKACRYNFYRINFGN